MTRRRAALLGGIAGPIAFVGAWIIGGLRAKGYSPAVDPISRLAASGASTRPLMTAGFVAFSVGLAAFAAGVRDDEHGNLWLVVAANALTTLGVAAAPLDAGVDNLHAAFAFAGYATLASMPLLRGNRAVAAAVALALAGSVAIDSKTGLLQRTGLTIGDAWIVVTAARAISSAGDR